MVSGRIRHHKETVATLEGHWDDKITIKDRKSQVNLFKYLIKMIENLHISLLYFH